MNGFEWQPADGYARTYGVANALNQATSQAGVGIAWDAAGNMTSDGVNAYAWTRGNRLAGVTRPGMSASYLYDSLDRRTMKTVNGVATRTLWAGTEPIAQYDTHGNLLRLIIPDGSGAMDGRLAVVEAGGDIRWQHTDHQGSVIALTDGAGTVQQINRYGPHGETAALGGSTGVGGIFGYTGREFDPESGLYQYRARYYSPLLGLFLSTDPIGTKDDPNLYLYVGGDPVNATDPTGMQIDIRGARTFFRAAGALIRAEIAFYGQGASDYMDGNPSREADYFEAAMTMDPSLVVSEVTGVDRSVVGLAMGATVGLSATARRGGESFATREGRRAHNAYGERARSEGLRTGRDARLPSGGEPDAIDDATNTVRELKPDNPRAVRSGERQVERYRQELEETTGEPWTAEVNTYRPRRPE